jgi:small subunit ribosomal protein S3
LGQKSNPIGLRLGINKTWNSRWFAKSDKFAVLLKEDMLIRRYIGIRLQKASISNVGIDRTAKRIVVNIFTARPGIVIGKKGEEVERLKEELQHITGKEVYINIREIKRPEIDAQLVGENIAQQIERRISYKRAMKKAIQSAMRMGAQGIKIAVSGRLGGAEMSRRIQIMEGRVPLHTLRADIDYAPVIARTTYGVIGIKVWIFKGEIIKLEKQETAQVQN